MNKNTQKPDLVEIVAGTVALTPKDQKRVSNFVIKVKLVRASEAEKTIAKELAVSSSGASVPVPSASAAVVGK